MKTESIVPVKTAVIGADGLIGQRLFDYYNKFDSECLGTFTPGLGQKPEFDLKNPDITPFHLHESGYQDVVIAAAVTGLNTCEENIKFTRLCNVTGTLSLINQLAEYNLKPIYFSSDNVFDGHEGNYTEKSLFGPLNEYGKQKVDVEKKISIITRGNYLVLRLGKVFDLKKGDGTLIDEIASRLSKGLEVKAAHDQILSPILIDDIVHAIVNLQVNNAVGVFHVCSPETWTRYELAIRIASALGVDTSLVKSISLDDLNEKFKRPKKTNMNCDYIRSFLSFDFTSIHKCIKYVAENYKR